MINLSEQNGGEKHTCVVLFKSALDEQKRMKNKTVSSSRGQKILSNSKESSGALVQGLLALRERGDKLESMGNKTANLRTDAANFAQLAKEMKEKSKNTTKLFRRF